MVTNIFRITLVAKFEFSGNCEIFRKLIPKEVPETTNIDYLGGIESKFRDFGAFYKKVIF